MLRSLYSGISGLNAHQKMIDVTGNNIANVNTNGFKATAVRFTDTLSQALGTGGSPQDGMAGTNPAQVGLGVKIGSINQNFGQGSAQTTGKAGDMMIQGDGFFITRTGNENLYTRAGSFFFDANGTLATANGEPVQGWTADSSGKVNTAAKPSDIRMPLGGTIPPIATTTATLKGNLSSDETPDLNNPSNTGLNYKSAIPIKVYDAKGATSTVLAEFSRTGTASTWGVKLLAEDGSEIGTGTTLTMTNGKPDTIAHVNPVTQRATITIGTFIIDVTDITEYSGNTDARVFATDGQTAGALTSLSYSVSETGEIVGVFSNGLKQTLGQVALATFKNVNGLEKIGNSSYRTTINSGYAQVGEPGSAGMGTVMSGALEMSNVDLAQEFTNLVVAQRGFQAASRIITTSDEILQELVSMKR